MTRVQRTERSRRRSIGGRNSDRARRFLGSRNMIIGPPTEWVRGGWRTSEAQLTKDSKRGLLAGGYNVQAVNLRANRRV